MASREVVFSPQAERDIKGLSQQNQKLAITALEQWAQGDGKYETEKIKSQPDFFRLRAGCLRVIYYPLSRGRVVILMIRDRKDAYRNLDALPAKLETAMTRLNLIGERRL